MDNLKVHPPTDLPEDGQTVVVWRTIGDPIVRTFRRGPDGPYLHDPSEKGYDIDIEWWDRLHIDYWVPANPE